MIKYAWTTYIDSNSILAKMDLSVFTTKALWLKITILTTVKPRQAPDMLVLLQLFRLTLMELLATQMNSKPVSVSLKDRSAILAIGHTANGAYWFSGGDERNFISSTFYMDALPAWATYFNSYGKIDDYLTT